MAPSSRIDSSTASGIEITTIERGAPAAEEQQDQQAGEAGGDQAFDHDRAHRVHHEHRLVEQERELESLGQLHLAEPLARLADDVERGRVAALEHREQARLAPVDAHEARLFVVAVADGGHVPDVGHALAARTDREVADLLDLLRTVVERQDVLARRRSASSRWAGSRSAGSARR